MPPTPAPAPAQVPPTAAAAPVVPPAAPASPAPAPAAPAAAAPPTGTPPAPAPAPAAAPAAPAAAKPADAPPAPGAKPDEAPDPSAPPADPLAEVVLPKDTLLDASDLEAVKALAKEKGLNADQAKLLLEQNDAAVNAFYDRQMADFNAKQEVWKGHCFKHPELGGAKFAESSELSNRFLQTYGSPELIKALEESKYGWFPPLWEAMVKAAKDLQDDTVPAAGATPATRPSDEQVLFGKGGK